MSSQFAQHRHQSSARHIQLVVVVRFIKKYRESREYTHNRGQPIQKALRQIKINYTSSTSSPNFCLQIDTLLTMLRYIYSRLTLIFMAISSAQVTTQGSTPATNKELGGVHQRKLPLAKGVGPNCHLQRYQASRQNRKLGVEFQHKSQSSKRPNRYCITLCRVIAAISFRFSSFLFLFFTATRLSALAIYQTLLNVTARTLCGKYIFIYIQSCCLVLKCA